VGAVRRGAAKALAQPSLEESAMKCWALATLVLVVACGQTWADDKANPTGTWTWTMGMGDRQRTVTMKLKLEGDKLTGAMLGRDNQETAIENGSFKDGTVSFTVTRERQGQKFTTKYNGKLDGDTIKGKITFEREGQEQSVDWDAKRKKD
jgi:hypothetical protein